MLVATTDNMGKNMSAANANTQMLLNQILPNKVQDIDILNALSRVKREAYVPTALVDVAYVDADISLGEGRVMLAPLTLSQMFLAANIQPQDRLLIVGGGTGYSAAVAAQLGAKIYMLEENKTLSTHAKATLAAQGVRQVEVIEAYLKDGYGFGAPYDVIVVEGGAEMLPAAIVAQLKEGGRLVWLQQKSKRLNTNAGMASLSVSVQGKNGFSTHILSEVAASCLPGFETPAAFAF